MIAKHIVRLLSAALLTCIAGLILFNPSYWGSDNAALKACLDAQDRLTAIESCTKAIEQDYIYDRERGEAAFRLAMATTSIDADRAVDLYTQTIELYPARTSAFYNRGLIYRTAKEYELAATDFTTVIDRITPENATKYSGAYRLRADVLEELERYNAAMADVDQALSFDPNDIQAILTKADILSAQEKFDEALVILDTAIAAHPQHRHAARLWQDRAWTRTQIGDIEGALADIDRALELDSASAWAWYWRAKLHARNGDPKTAFTDFRKSLEINPSYCRAIRGQKRLIKKLEGLAEAAPLMARITVDSILADHPEDPRLLHLRFLASSQAGELETALEDVNRLIDVSELAELSIYQRAKLYRQLGKNDLAIADLQRIIENDSKYSEAFVAISEEAEALSNADFECAADALISANMDLLVLRRFAISEQMSIHANVGDWDSVIIAVNLMIEDDPDDVDHLRKRGIALEQLNRPFDAISSYDEAVLLIESGEAETSSDKNGYARIYMYRASVHQSQQRVEQAQRDFDNALKLGDSEFVKTFQLRMQKAGHYGGPINGIYDEATKDAMHLCASDVHCTES